MFYLATEPTEALEKIICRSCSAEEKTTFNYMHDLDAGIVAIWIVYIQRLTTVP